MHRILVVIALLAGVPASVSADPLELGANFNENLHAATVPALDATGVTWIRGFLPAGEFLDGRRSLASDRGVAAFQAAAASGRRVAITLKWDFKRSHWRVPAPDSDAERKAFVWSVDVVRATHPDLLLLVNEVFIDTEEADMQPGPDGVIPMVRFLQRLAAHLHAARLLTPSGAPLPLSCGGFTRLDRANIQTHPATRALLPWLADSPDLAGVNFHLHEFDVAQFEAALKFIRTAVPRRPFIVTEFSFVWEFQRHLNDPIRATDAGRAFADQYHEPAGATAADFLNAAARQPVPEEELHAFLASQPWFDPQLLEKACGLMERYGVTLATYAYLQGASGLERLNPVSPRQPPWRLNPVFQERHAYVPGSDRMATNLGFYDTFVRRQRKR